MRHDNLNTENTHCYAAAVVVVVGCVDVVVVVTPAAIAGGQVVREGRWRQCRRRHPKPANLLIFNNTLCQYEAYTHAHVHMQSIKETRVRTLAHMHTHVRVYSVYMCILMYIYRTDV